MKIAARLQALESRSVTLPTGEVHFVVRHAPQSEDEAIDAYGRDKIGKDDDLIFFRVGVGLDKEPPGQAEA